MDNNKASVKIYGQEYVIAGEKSREHIVKVAAYVDNKMHDISETASSCPVSSLAVLSAVNICDEYFTALAELESMKRKNAQLENDAQRYVQLWEEAKKNFTQYKEESQKIVNQKDELQKMLAEKAREIEHMKTEVVSADEEAEKKAEASIQELNDKCRELENSFFDTQMENIQLKKELNKLKKG